MQANSTKTIFTENGKDYCITRTEDKVINNGYGKGTCKNFVAEIRRNGKVVKSSSSNVKGLVMSYQCAKRMLGDWFHSGF